MARMDTTAGGYRLLDAGGGRRLERFGDRVVDRPQPGAVEPPRAPAAWREADLRYERWTGWHASAGALTPWQVEVAEQTLELRPTDAGQVGLFPEHLASIAWLQAQARRLGPDMSDGALNADRGDGSPPIVLNLFAYTGLATLALAQAGAAVVHVDSSRPAVTWARRNADLSGLADRPIRWIVDDAETFVTRELRRGRRYDGVILDPPSYGHDDRGRSWRLEERLPGLLSGCAQLTAGRPGVLPPDCPFGRVDRRRPGRRPRACVRANRRADGAGRDGDPRRVRRPPPAGGIRPPGSPRVIHPMRR